MDNWIRHNETMWILQDIKQNTQPHPQHQQPQYPAPNPTIVYVNDKELWNLDSPPPSASYIDIAFFIFLISIVILILVKHK